MQFFLKKTTSLQNQISKVFIVFTNYYTLAKIWDLEIYLERNDCLSNFVGNLHGNTFLFFTFIKLKDYWNFTYTDMYKMGFWNTVYRKLGLYKAAVFKFWAVKYSVQFWVLSVLSKSLWKNNHFLMHIFWNSIQDIVFCQVLKSPISFCFSMQHITRNATRFNNRNDLVRVSFTLIISKFSEVYT